MNIQDQAKREAAVKKILDGMSDGPEGEKAPAPAAIIFCNGLVLGDTKSAKQ